MVVQDEKISSLVRQLHMQSSGDQDRALKLILAETDRDSTQGEGEDYLRPLSPQTTQDLENLEVPVKLICWSCVRKCSVDCLL